MTMKNTARQCAYYMQNGLQLPQRITAELQASRILRAVLVTPVAGSEVDFWTNHFNVFAGKGADRCCWCPTTATRFGRTRGKLF